MLKKLASALNALGKILTPTRRKTLYKVAAIVVPLLVTAGLISGDAAPTIVAIIGTILVPGVAHANVDTNQS